MKFSRQIAVCSVLTLPFLALTGCNSAPAVRLDMTNAADSTARTSAQDANEYARVIDHNTRMAWDDLSRLMLLDRTSRLSPYIVP